MFSDMIEYLPVVIRIGAVIMIIAILYDYLKREWARSLVETLKNAGAVCRDNAITTDELEGLLKGARRIISVLLSNEYSPLRRVVKCINTESDDSQNSKKRSAKLSGREKWYLLMPSADDEDTAATSGIPYVLRDGGENNRIKLIIGIVIVFAFAELLIYFLPQIESFFTGVSSFGKE